MISAFFTGLAGQTLTAAERAFLRASQPAGIILFARNATHPGQVRRLIGAAREAIGRNDVLVLIDQEGGRVQRLRPPHWRALPEAALFGKLRSMTPNRPAIAARLIAELNGSDLQALGINCNCAPVLDVPVPGAHDVIGNRAYGTTVAAVTTLGRATLDGYLASGVLPVVKHIPGHGRAGVDSHLSLPRVDTPRVDLEATDFAAFKALADAPAAMSAHVVFTAIDPDAPTSRSKRVHDEIIRGHIGFGGLLMSDDLSMKALDGTMRSRTEAVRAAGTDIALYCNGHFTEMEQVADGSGRLDGVSLQRFSAGVALTHKPASTDLAAAEACLAELMRLSA